MSHAERILQHPTYESAPGYWQRHERAILAPGPREAGIVTMLRGWLVYADRHRERYGYHQCPRQCLLTGKAEATQHDPGICPRCGSQREPGGGIGDDYVLGPEWARIGAALRGLLNGDCGRLDCGALDSILNDTLRAEGFDPSTEDWNR